MGTEKGNRTVNKCIMQGWTIIGAVLLIAYIIEMAKGKRTFAYFAVFSIINLVPLIISWVVYMKDQASERIKYLCSIFYFIFYVYVLLTGATPMVFCYLLPMLYLLMLCNDHKMIGFVGIGNVIANVVCILVQITVEKKAVSDYLTEWEIQIAATVLCSLFAYMAVKVSGQLHRAQMQAAEEGEKRLEDVFGKVTEVSGTVEEAAAVMLQKLVLLEEASEKTSGSMQGIVAGTAQSAEMVERQLHKTSDIQSIIDYTNEVSEKIAQHVAQTSDSVRSGLDNMKKLSDSAKGVEENSGRVIEHMAMLRETAGQVENIISIINGIAGQTNLLALNASIEAARAGEAGRGFAVVADEINGLANQTKESTQSIAEMVNSLRSKADEASAAVQEMGELNKVQSEIIFETEAAFGKIRDGVDEVRKNADEERQQMDKLMSANAEIIDSIQTISAVTEEVTANSNQTQDVTTDNQEIVEQVTELAKVLETKVTELKGYVS